MGRKTVLLLGAGASIADVATRPQKMRPPLDRAFFRMCAAAEPNDWRAHNVRAYMQDTYGVDIFTQPYDSLEGVMGRLYPDNFNDLVARDAQRAFRALLQLFTKRLATTTNDIRPTKRRLLYRMVTQLLSEGCDPCDITVITFNQDIQVEKTLELISRPRAGPRSRIGCSGFPTCTPCLLALGSGSGSQFPRAPDDSNCLRVLKPTRLFELVLDA